MTLKWAKDLILGYDVAYLTRYKVHVVHKGKEGVGPQSGQHRPCQWSLLGLPPPTPGSHERSARQSRRQCPGQAKRPGPCTSLCKEAMSYRDFEPRQEELGPLSRALRLLLG